MLLPPCPWGKAGPTATPLGDVFPPSKDGPCACFPHCYSYYREFFGRRQPSTGVGIAKQLSSAVRRGAVASEERVEAKERGPGTGRRGRGPAQVRPSSLHTSTVWAASCWYSHTKHHCSGRFPRPRMPREGRLHWIQPMLSTANGPHRPLCPQQPPWLLPPTHTLGAAQGPAGAGQGHPGQPLAEAMGGVASQLTMESSGLSLFFAHHSGAGAHITS